MCTIFFDLYVFLTQQLIYSYLSGLFQWHLPSMLLTQCQYNPDKYGWNRKIDRYKDMTNKTKNIANRVYIFGMYYSI